MRRVFVELFKSDEGRASHALISNIIKPKRSVRTEGVASELKNKTPKYILKQYELEPNDGIFKNNYL